MQLLPLLCHVVNSTLWLFRLKIMRSMTRGKLPFNLLQRVQLIKDTITFRMWEVKLAKVIWVSIALLVPNHRRKSRNREAYPQTCLREKLAMLQQILWHRCSSSFYKRAHPRTRKVMALTRMTKMRRAAYEERTLCSAPRYFPMTAVYLNQSIPSWPAKPNSTQV